MAQPLTGRVLQSFPEWTWNLLKGLLWGHKSSLNSYGDTDGLNKYDSQIALL